MLCCERLVETNHIDKPEQKCKLVLNNNHIDKPEQKRCVRELETCGFKCKLLIIIILIT